MAKTEKEKKFSKSKEKEAAKIEMVSKLAKRKKSGKYFPKNVDGTKATDTRAALNTFEVQKIFDRDLKRGKGSNVDLISDRRLASKEGSMRTGGLSTGQKKLAAKAPPPNKLDEKDFKVLREEKAKGRGMGLQDEKVQPGKVMKANKGKMTPLKKDPTRPTNPFAKKAIDKTKRIMGRGGRLGAAAALLGLAGAGAAKLGQTIGRKMSEKKDKKMGGGMMKKYSKGGGADSGKIGEMKSRLAVALDKAAGGFRKGRGKVSPRDYDKITERTNAYALAQSMKDKDRLTDRDIKKASSLVKGKMGGGMIGPSQRPGYSKGTMVKARGCKLGRTRPTKIT